MPHAPLPSPSAIKSSVKNNADCITFYDAYIQVYKKIKELLKAKERRYQLQDQSMPMSEQYDEKYLRKMARLLLLKGVYCGELSFYCVYGLPEDMHFATRINFKKCYEDLVKSLQSDRLKLNFMSSLECLSSNMPIYQETLARYGVLYEGLLESQKESWASWFYLIESIHFSPYTIDELSQVPDLFFDEVFAPEHNNSSSSSLSAYLADLPRAESVSDPKITHDTSFALEPYGKEKTTPKKIFSKGIVVDRESIKEMPERVELIHYKHKDKLFSMACSTELPYDKRFYEYCSIFKESFIQYLPSSDLYGSPFDTWAHFYMFLFCNGINISNDKIDNFKNITGIDRHIHDAVNYAYVVAKDFFSGFTVLSKEESKYFCERLYEERIFEYLNTPWSEIVSNGGYVSSQDGTDGDPFDVDDRKTPEPQVCKADEREDARVDKTEQPLLGSQNVENMTLEDLKSQIREWKKLELFYLDLKLKKQQEDSGKSESEAMESKENSEISVQELEEKEYLCHIAYLFLDIENIEKSDVFIIDSVLGKKEKGKMTSGGWGQKIKRKIENLAKEYNLTEKHKSVREHKLTKEVDLLFGIFMKRKENIKRILSGSSQSNKGS